MREKMIRRVGGVILLGLQIRSRIRIVPKHEPIERIG